MLGWVGRNLVLHLLQDTQYRCVDWVLKDIIMLDIWKDIAMFHYFIHSLLFINTIIGKL